MRKHWKPIAALVAMITFAAVMVGTPAGAHVSDWTHNWIEHIRPRTDARYYQKTQVYTKAQSNTRYYTKVQSDSRYWTTGEADARYQRNIAPLSQIQHGVFGATAPANGFAIETIQFDPRLPFDIPFANAHRLAVGQTNPFCTGPGSAAAGHLCLYEAWNSGPLNWIGFHDPNSSGLAVRARGTIAIWSATITGANVRGTWTVRAPSAGAEAAGAVVGECTPGPTMSC